MDSIIIVRSKSQQQNVENILDTYKSLCSKYKCFTDMYYSEHTFLSEKEHRHIDGRYYSTDYRYSSGLIRVSKLDDNLNELHGYANINGKLIIPLKFFFASDFQYGTAWVSTCVDGKAGMTLIDTKGNILFPPQHYTKARVLGPNLYLVRKFVEEENREKWGLIDNYNNLLLPFIFDYFSYKVCVVGDYLASAVRVTLDEGKEGLAFGLVNIRTGSWQMLPLTLSSHTFRPMLDYNTDKFGLRFFDWEYEECGVFDTNKHAIEWEFPLDFLSFKPRGTNASGKMLIDVCINGKSVIECCKKDVSKGADFNLKTLNELTAEKMLKIIDFDYDKPQHPKYLNFDYDDKEDICVCLDIVITSDAVCWEQDVACEEGITLKGFWFENIANTKFGKRYVFDRCQYIQALEELRKFATK